MPQVTLEGPRSEKPMGFLQKTSLTILTRWTGYGLEGIASIVVARSVGPVGKGMLAVLNVLGGLAVQMGNLGLHAATAHFTAREGGALGRIASISLVLAPTMGAILATGLGAVVLTFPTLIPNVPWLLVVVTLVGIPFAFLLLFFQNILLGQQRIGAYNLLDIGAKVLSLPLVLIILLVFQGSVQELVIAGFLVYVATALLAVRLVFRGVTLASLALDGLLVRRMIAYGSRSYLACLLAFLIIRADMLLVNYFLGAAQAGIYAVSVNLADLMLVFPTTVGTMLFPRVSAQEDDDGTLTAAASRHTAAGMAGLCLTAGIVVRPLIQFLYGDAFRGAAAPFLLLLPGIFALSLESIFMNDLAGRGLPPIVIGIPAVGLVLNLILNLAFIPRFGILAAAGSSSLAYCVMLVIAWVAFARRTATPAVACGLLTSADIRALYDRIRPASLSER